jgi:hypothetical protein
LRWWSSSTQTWVTILFDILGGKIDMEKNRWSMETNWGRRILDWYRTDMSHHRKLYSPSHPPSRPPSCPAFHPPLTVSLTMTWVTVMILVKHWDISPTTTRLCRKTCPRAWELEDGGGLFCGTAVFINAYCWQHQSMAEHTTKISYSVDRNSLYDWSPRL